MKDAVIGAFRFSNSLRPAPGTHYEHFCTLKVEVLVRNATNCAENFFKIFHHFFTLIKTMIVDVQYLIMPVSCLSFLHKWTFSKQQKLVSDLLTFGYV